MSLAATISALAATAAARGLLAPDVRLLPSWQDMGGGGALGVLTSLLTVVSGEEAWEVSERPERLLEVSGEAFGSARLPAHSGVW